MSFFTKADAEYIKSSARKVAALTVRAVRQPSNYDEIIAERDAEYTRLEAFIDGCTMTGDRNANS